MKIVRHVINARTRLSGIVGTGSERWRTYLIQDGANLYLRVKAGKNFGLALTNWADHMVAYPSYLGRNGRPLVNVFVANREMNPNKLLANGGMMEAGEYGSTNGHGESYDTTAIDGLKLPGNEQQAFVAVEDSGISGQDADELLIYRRTRPGVTIAQVLGGAGRRDTPAGPRIGAAEKTADGRQLTGLDYLQDADNPIFRVRIVYPDQAAAMLDRAGVKAPPTWSYDRY